MCLGRCVHHTVCAVGKITLCDLHVGVLCVLMHVPMNYIHSMCLNMFCVSPMGVCLPCPLSLTNLAECNYSSMCLSGHREPAPPLAIKHRKKQVYSHNGDVRASH